MHFTTLFLPLVTLLSLVYAGPTVTVYSDAECKHANQVISLSRSDVYQCYTFKHAASAAVKFSTDGFQNRAWGVWDADYCDGDTVQSTAADLGKCLVAKDFGLYGWYTAHTSPYNPKPATPDK